MKPVHRLAVTAAATGALLLGGAGVAAAQTPAPGSLPDGPLVDLLVPLAVTETQTFGDGEASEYLCSKWSAMAPGWGYWDIGQCHIGDDGQWTVTAKKWPDWLQTLPAGSAA